MYIIALYLFDPPVEVDEAGEGIEDDDDATDEGCKEVAASMRPQARAGGMMSDDR